MTGLQHTHDRRRRGAVLLIAMWMLLILGVMLLALNRVTLVNVSRGHAELERVQAKWLARAGVEQFFDILTLDATGDDGPLDQWYDDPDSFQAVELGPGYTFTVASSDETYADGIRYGADDLAGRINVNFAERSLIAALPDMTEQIADSIVDWRDGNEEALPGGAERGYYGDLRYPYEIRNGPMRTHREMMLVRDIDDAVFFGDESRDALARFTTVWSYDSNFAPTGAQKIDLEEGNTSELTTRFGLTPSLGQEIQEENADDPFDLVGLTGDTPQDGLINEIEFQWVADNYEEFAAGGGRGGGAGAGGRFGSTAPGAANQQRAAKININTAPRDVLLTLSDIDEGAADAIIAARGQSGGYITIGELYSTGVVDDEAFRSLAPSITVRSNVIRVVSTGSTPGGTSASVEAVIDRGGDQPVIIYWHQTE